MVLIGDRLYHVVYARREDRRRIISFRAASGQVTLTLSQGFIAKAKRVTPINKTPRRLSRVSPRRLNYRRHPRSPRILTVASAIAISAAAGRMN